MSWYYYSSQLLYIVVHSSKRKSKAETRCPVISLTKPAYMRAQPAFCKNKWLRFLNGQLFHTGFQHIKKRKGALRWQAEMPTSIGRVRACVACVVSATPVTGFSSVQVHSGVHVSRRWHSTRFTRLCIQSAIHSFRNWKLEWKSYDLSPRPPPL